jgi:hypothetical protein
VVWGDSTLAGFTVVWGDSVPDTGALQAAALNNGDR